jgi:glutaredoxin 3
VDDSAPWAESETIGRKLMWWATWVCGRSALANGHGGEAPRESVDPGPTLSEVMSRITVYTTEPCGYCRVAKALLGKRSVPYTEVNLAKDPEGRAELVRLTGMMTFPQVVIDGEAIGGYQELVLADRQSRLADFAEAAA